jgi:hypothetical protein
MANPVKPSNVYRCKIRNAVERAAVNEGRVALIRESKVLSKHLTYSPFYYHFFFEDHEKLERGGRLSAKLGRSLLE